MKFANLINILMNIILTRDFFSKENSFWTKCFYLKKNIEKNTILKRIKLIS